MANQLTFIKWNKRGTTKVESECVHSKEVRIGAGGAGNGPALRVSFDDKKGRECVVLVDDEATLQNLIAQCQSVLKSREEWRQNQGQQTISPPEERRCPHCYSKAKPQYCRRCTRVMCEYCISDDPTFGPVCGSCLDDLNEARS